MVQIDCKMFVLAWIFTAVQFTVCSKRSGSVCLFILLDSHLLMNYYSASKCQMMYLVNSQLVALYLDSGRASLFSYQVLRRIRHLSFFLLSTIPYLVQSLIMYTQPHASIEIRWVANPTAEPVCLAMEDASERPSCLLRDRAEPVRLLFGIGCPINLCNCCRVPSRI
jgi:hypothetical protein